MQLSWQLLNKTAYSWPLDYLYKVFKRFVIIYL
jgi:hypothetical protein